MPAGYGYATNLHQNRMPGTGMPPFTNAPVGPGAQQGSAAPFSFLPQQRQQVQDPQMLQQQPQQTQQGDIYAQLLQNPQMQQQLQALFQQQPQGGPQNIIPGQQGQGLGLLSNLFGGGFGLF